MEYQEKQLFFVHRDANRTSVTLLTADKRAEAEVSCFKHDLRNTIACYFHEKKTCETSLPHGNVLFSLLHVCRSVCTFMKHTHGVVMLTAGSLLKKTLKETSFFN